MTYEKLLLEYDELTVIETDLSKVKGLKGLCIDDCIAIDKNLSYIEKGCILAEEIGHYLTSSGNILDQNKVSNRKQELKARSVAFDIHIGLYGLIEAYEAGCTCACMIAEYLNVTESFLHEALGYYKKKYGILTQFDSYIIYFEPTLGIMKML